MLESFKDFDFKKPLNIFKIAVLGLFGVAAIVFLASLVNSSVRPLLPRSLQQEEGSMSSVPGYAGFYGRGMASTDAVGYDKGVPELSARNIAPMPPQGTTGNTAEQFEVTDYNATIETRDKAETCARIADLKSLPHVIFEYSQESDRSCNYTFKVEQAKVGEILTLIKDLDPKDLHENTRTIKSQLDDFTNQTEILEKKRASIDETLQNAIKAYDEITALAVRTQDAASLAKIIDSKVQIIERLTQERININQQLDYLARAKADQMDRLDYTYFNVNIYENKFVDGENIKDSWKQAVQEFFYNINEALQNATVGLLAVVLMAIPYILYALLIVVLAKYGWRVVKKIWYK